MKTKILSLLMIILLLTLIFTSCSKKEEPVYVDYSIDNNYEVVITDTDDYLSFSPLGATPTYGLLFYVGTTIAPSSYTYLGNVLAKNGYLMVIPKADLTFAYFGYQEKELVFDVFKDVKFFIGGHSQGGGAAIRRTEENQNATVGSILLAPLASSHSIVNSLGDSESYKDTISYTSIPTLLLEASEDHILTAAQKNDAKTRLPENYISYTIEGGCHMCFADRDPMLTDGPMVNMTKEEQHEWTIDKVLNFMKEVVNK